MVAAERSGGRMKRIRLVLILGALSAFAPLSIDMYLPALPALSRDFGATASEAQLTLSAFFLGLALGQVVTGPLSDALGRRRPILGGVGAYVATSLLCAFAPSISVLVGLRFAQGFAGAAGIVIARAVVRDLHSGVAAARFLSVLMLVSGLAPVLAPVIGGQLLRFAPWPGVFITLAVLSALLLVATAAGLDETLPPESRQTGGLQESLLTFRELVSDRAYLGYALACGLATAAMFAYIAGSPFVLQERYGVSPQVFSYIFGTNAIGLAVAGQINGQIVGAVSPSRLLGAGLLAAALGGIGLLAAVVGGSAPLGVVLVALFVVVASLGFIMPNATVLALSGAPRIAGSASALLGLLQFSIGAAVAPLVGIAGSGTALPMAVIIAALEVCAAVAFLFASRAPALDAAHAAR
ncbi:MAG: multidrug effflux MFS transporter [Chloroflexi bacterium]|nr:multidrug effflux MFS transporter [Chloroflexota bacterium]